MKKSNLVMSLLCIVSVFSDQANAELEARFAGAQICADQDIIACSEGKGVSEISLYVIGDGFARIDESSLQLTKLTIGDKDILEDEIGRPNYELDSFPDIEDDGKVAEFEITVKSSLDPLHGPLSIEGTIVFDVGNDLQIEESTLFNPLESQEMQVGPLKITSEEDELQHTFNIEGHNASIASIKLFNRANEEIDSVGYFSSGSVRSENFEKTDDTQVKLVVSHYKSIKPQKVKIKF